MESEELVQHAGNTAEPSLELDESKCHNCGAYVTRTGMQKWTDLSGGSLCSAVPSSEIERHHRTA